MLVVLYRGLLRVERGGASGVVVKSMGEKGGVCAVLAGSPIVEGALCVRIFSHPPSGNGCTVGGVFEVDKEVPA
jgi:hypothetical protein